MAKTELNLARLIIMDQRMLFRAVLIRLVALIVLITSAFDYCAFDVWDPAAPMSSAGLETIRDLVPGHPASAQIRTSESSDDHCLGCAPGISPRPAILHRITLTSSLFHPAEASVPSSDPIIPERPPRA
jgi:hypothetical protein